MNQRQISESDIGLFCTFVSYASTQYIRKLLDCVHMIVAVSSECGD